MTKKGIIGTIVSAIAGGIAIGFGWKSAYTEGRRDMLNDLGRDDAEASGFNGEETTTVEPEEEETTIEEATDVT